MTNDGSHSEVLSFGFFVFLRGKHPNTPIIPHGRRGKHNPIIAINAVL